MSNQSILESPPSSIDEGELVSALDVAPPSRRSVTITRVLVGLLLVALGATGATWWAHRSGSASATTGLPSIGQLPAGFPTGIPGGGAGAGATGTGGSPADAGSATGSGASGAATTGTVKLVDGDTVYVATEDGKVVKVTVVAATSVSKPATLADLSVGSTVVVTGTTASDGTVTATTVTERATK